MNDPKDKFVDAHSHFNLHASIYIKELDTYIITLKIVKSQNVCDPDSSFESVNLVTILLHPQSLSHFLF